MFATGIRNTGHWNLEFPLNNESGIRGLPVRPPREERTKHETKPKETRVLKGRVFVPLIAFVGYIVLLYC